MADYLTHDLLGSEVIQSSRGAVHARLTEYPEAFRWGSLFLPPALGGRRPLPPAGEPDA